MLKKISCLAAGLILSVAAWAAPSVEIATSMGPITLELYPEKAPKTVASFLKNVRSGFYGETIFHRVIDGFMIQGGGFTANMQEKPVATPPLQNESTNGLGNERGTIAMARTSDPHSARAQFFINLNDNDFLNHRTTADPRGWGYTVFGKVTRGMDVVDKIARVPTGVSGYYENVPTTPVVIRNIKVISEK